ncbi:MAG: prepilin peptidase [Verrucomicrobiota bacterium]|nr:prepilin peptidase [Verrucomicrobiota bacterium]
MALKISTPSREARRTNLPVMKPLRKGLEAWLYDWVGKRRSHKSNLDVLLFEAEQVQKIQQTIGDTSTSQLHGRMRELRALLLRHGFEQRPILIEAMAYVAENAYREIGLMPYREQIAGALGLLNCNLMEMATGEGKTLTLGLAVALAGWRGHPVHVVTANDYLAERDAINLGRHYKACGLDVGFVTGTMEPADRRRNYAADIVYTTAKELVADFLRDRLQFGDLSDAARRHIRLTLQPKLLDNAQIVQRGLHSVFVDEADYILVDEAVTPLIISKQKENRMLKAASRAAYDFALSLQADVDYTANAKFHEIELSQATLDRLEKEPIENPPVLRNTRWRREMIEQVLKAREFYKLGKNYIIDEGKVVIVDEGTGRQMPNRSWRLGLHQAVEHKEGLKMSDPAETLAGISFQRFFRLIPQLAGVTGTAKENARELWRIYGLPVIQVPTHKPCLRTVDRVCILPDMISKWEAVWEDIRTCHATGRPVLVGTRSVIASESLAEVLRGEGVHFQLLNAVSHRSEAAIVANAGNPASITIATNMAGRGTDIRLSSGIAEMGGLHVVATEYHESARVDRQLYGRCARQGDPGSVSQYLSLEDDVITRFTPKWIVRLLQKGLRQKFPGTEKTALWAARLAQRAATRQNYRQRVGVLDQDKWAAEQLSFGSGPRGI